MALATAVGLIAVDRVAARVGVAMAAPGVAASAIAMAVPELFAGNGRWQAAAKSSSTANKPILRRLTILP